VWRTLLGHLEAEATPLAHQIEVAHPLMLADFEVLRPTGEGKTGDAPDEP